MTSDSQSMSHCSRFGFASGDNDKPIFGIRFHRGWTHHHHHQQLHTNPTMRMTMKYSAVVVVLWWWCWVWMFVVRIGDAFTIPTIPTPRGRSILPPLQAARLLPPPPPPPPIVPMDHPQQWQPNAILDQVTQLFQTILPPTTPTPLATSTISEWGSSASSTIASWKNLIVSPLLPPPNLSFARWDLFWQSWRAQIASLDQDIVIPRLRQVIESLQTMVLAVEQNSMHHGSSEVVRLTQTVSNSLQQALVSLSSSSSLDLQHSPTTIAAIVLVSAVATSIAAVLAATTTPSPNSSSSSINNQQPYPLLKYDPVTAQAYFNRRWPMVAARGMDVAWQSLQFGLSLLSDKVQDKMAMNELQRGRELAVLLTRLGPTFIKVGQSLSIRTDLLSPAYIRGLETLQDQVPSFATATAREILQAEWGRPISEVLLDDLTAEPIAAASLGQVYKARLRSSSSSEGGREGDEVAIKVQRPDILVKIALDMHLLRISGALLKRVVSSVNTDLVGTVDAWGAGFVDEIDYIQEGVNGATFSAQIRETPLRDVVFAPHVLTEYSTRKVLVTSWVNGERLDRSNSEDVSVLCSIAMNTYLTMLLELGMLHCDPHPGNLLRTPEGKLCILDFGMVTRINKDLQLTLIEHMAHLTSADYAEIPRDLLLLGFVPEDKADVIGDSGVVEVLADIYGAWTSGGGVAAINVNKVIAQLQDLTAKKGNLFRIPPYFAYIAKSFSVLEGIGLSNDPKYSIINECLPYVSRRLLTDKDKMGPALSTFIFGPEKQNADRIVDYKRVEQLVEGFGEYSTSASGALLGKANVSRAVLLEEAADQILDLVFTEEETTLQEIILEQMAKIISANGRTIWTELRERSGTLPTGRTRLGTLVDPLGLWRTSPLVRTNELDDKTVETTRKLVSLMQRQIQNSDNPLFDSMSREDTLQFASILVRKIWTKRSGVLSTSNRFARKLLQLTADQLEKGERDSRRVPTSKLASAPQSTALVVEDENTGRQSSSQRLEGARRLLNEVRDQQLSLDETNSAIKTSSTIKESESSRLTEARQLLLDLQPQQRGVDTNNAESVRS